MTAKGWKIITVRDETAEKIKTFQVLAITHTQRLHTISEAVEYAIEVATKALTDKPE